MADEIFVKYKADLSVAEKSLSDYEKKLRSTEATGKKTFKGIEDAGTSMGNKLSETFGEIGSGIVAAFSVAAITSFIKTSVAAFGEAEKGSQKLLVALKNNRAAYEILTKQAEALQDKLGVDDDVIISLQSYLAVQGRTTDQIKRTVEAAVELSAVTGETLQGSVEKLDATFEGNIGRLGKLDARFKDLTAEQLANGAAVDLVNEKYKGFSDGTLNNTETQLAKVKTFFGNITEDIGSGFAALIAQVGVAGQLVQAFVDRIFGLDPNKAKEAEDSYEKYFTNVENTIQKANRKNFDQVANGLIENAKANLTAFDKQYEDINKRRLHAIQIGNIDEANALVQAQAKLKATNVQNEQDRVDRVIEIINKEREKKKPIFQGQADDEAAINKKKRDEEQAFQDMFDAAVLDEQRRTDKEYLDLKKKNADDFQKFFEKALEDNAKEIDIDNKKRLDYEKAAAAEKENIRQAEFDSAKSILTMLQELENQSFQVRNEQLQAREDAVNTQFDKEATALEKLNERKGISDLEYSRRKEILDKKREISEATFAKQQRKLAHDQAVVNKTFAIFNIILNTAQGIISALALTPPNVPLSIAIGIAGATQLATAAAAPIPALAEGTKEVKLNGRPKGKDTVLAWLDEGERVISGKKNRNNWEIYEAIDNNKFHELVHRKYVMPVLLEYQKKQAEKERANHAAQIGHAVFSNINGLSAHEMKKLWDKGIVINNLPESESGFQPGKYGSW